MRKLLFAGAVAGGFLLLGGAPAHADVLPTPAGADGSSLGDVLTPRGFDPAGGLNLESPLGGSLIDVTPGDNTPGVDPATLLPSENAPAAREADSQAGLTPPGGLPAAGAVANALPKTNGVDVPVVGGLLGGGGLPGAGLLGGLPTGGFQPNGRMPAGPGESGLVDPGWPMLDAIAGVLPGQAGSARTLPAIDPTDFSGMPLGGTPVNPADAPATTKPATTDTDPDPAADPGPAAGSDPTTGSGSATGSGPAANSGPAAGEGPAADPGAGSGATDDAKRLHEEPIDDEATQRQDNRSFSTDERPVAGVDPGFN